MTVPVTIEDRARLRALEVYELLDNIVTFMEVYAVEHDQHDLTKNPWWIIADATCRNIRNGAT